MTGQSRRMNVLERYLTLWVSLSMVTGMVLGKAPPELVAVLRGLEFGFGRQINIPIAVLIWLMSHPMML